MALIADPLSISAQFERGLDPSARARLGAYYTARDDILLLVEPVLMQPLRREWEAIQGVEAHLAAPLRESLLKRLRTMTILDPACGAGNFLVVALQALQQLEQTVIQHPLWRDLPPELPQVGPHQVFGIERDPTACDLARALLQTVWEGGSPSRADAADNIRCMDAILGVDQSGTPCHPPWPTADVILSNPPFLGSRKLRPELGSAYVEGLKALYGEAFGRRTPDLVCYWFERARRELDAGHVRRVGLLATNSIRGGTNRRALERIAQTGRIFLAWSDREWRENGVGVNVSVVGFDRGEETTRVLDGRPVAVINPDLTTGPNVAAARPLPENRGIAFQGIIRRGGFDLTEAAALDMLAADPRCADVLRPLLNGTDIARQPRRRWVIDFGVNTPIEIARRYERPFAYVEQRLRPSRARTNQPDSRERWWLHWNPRPELRQALAPLRRYIATPAVAKHRIFTWVERGVHPDHALIVFARDDDYCFGVLHSRIHRLWALRMGTSLEDRPRYTPTTCFETFPFPWSPGEEETASVFYHAIGNAARRLYEERTAWLIPSPSPSQWGAETGKAKPPRTLTALYNALQAYRGEPYGGKSVRTLADARDFAPRLDDLHRALDVAVCDAYGWEHAVLDDDTALVERLLALNEARGAHSSGPASVGCY